MRLFPFSLIALFLLVGPVSAQQLEIKPNDHICIIGNTLAERMQHDGWLEVYFHTRFPRHDLVFRNLGFSGDELTVRLRSMDFGTPDQWLSGSAPIPQPKKLNKDAPVRANRFEKTNTKADVVFAFFGYNESFAGPAGLPKFKTDLAGFIQHTLQQKYNGRTAPRLVLFSPIAFENRHDRNLPDGTGHNKRLQQYTDAMAEVAQAHKVPFVDLFRPMLAAYQRANRPLTINGVHLNSDGNRRLAEIIDQALFPHGPAIHRDLPTMEKLRQAVLDRNFHWFQRYRTVDGYSMYGDRAFLRFVGGQTNYEVMQRELEVLDVMTANRDKRIWAIARGADLTPDDSNAPPFLPVPTNKPGKGPGGQHLFLDGQEAIKLMKLAPGLKVNLFASEKEFPDLVNPVQMSWDTRGRLWVAVWPTYPHWKPREPMNDKLLIFEDTDGDGKADRMTVFADKLHCPTGFEFWNGGVLICQGPDLWFLKDTDNDDRADVRQRVLHGLDTADTHHTANSFVFDPGGALYFQEGVFHHTQVETPWGPPVRNINAGVYRYEPRTHKFEVYVNYGFANPHGHVFDRWGQDFVIDGTGAVPYHAALFSGQTDFPQRHSGKDLPHLYKQKTRPCPGMEILSSRHFPPENQGNLLVANVINFLGILQYKIRDKGASFEGIEVEPILSSSDPNFRPSDIRMGPDGAIYFIDWHNPIIGHMQHNLRDPSRDREHGRIYRIIHEQRPLLQPAKIHGEPIEKLLDLLKIHEDRVRYRTRIELGARPTDAVLAALRKWVANLDKKDPEYQHHLLEALWLYQNHNVVHEELLQQLLRSPDYRARAAATRVLCYWRDRVHEPLELLRGQINDSHPRVRLEAIRALSFFHDEKALGVALEMLTHPDDPYLRYTFNETLNTLEKRLGSGRLDRKNIAASLVGMLEKGSVPADRLPVLIETITRHGGARELKAIWERALKKDGYAPSLLRQVLEWLAEAAVTRRVQPEVDPAVIRRWLQEGNNDGKVPEAVLLPETIRLATAWKVKEAGPELRTIARNSQATLRSRFAALDALAALGEADNLQILRELAASASPLALRFRAATALAQVDLDGGAKAAAAALAAAKESDDLTALVEAFLQRKNGSDKLAAALAKEKVSPDTAKRILRAMFLAGRNDAGLTEVASKLAGLDAKLTRPTPEEIRQILTEVASRGDPARGEQVFRRADLGCLKCHALNKAGGNIGPDLGPIGGSSPLDYIVTSILDPNASIKEEYLTRVISTTRGQLITGVVVERTRDRVVLKDATGKLVRIPTAEIDEEAAGKSLMPEGITRILTRSELLDLLRFVSELGKPGPYASPTVPVIQRWRKLREVPAVLRDGIPNRDLVRDQLLQTNPAAWDTVYTLVNGTLPLAELGKATRSEVIYLQGEIQVTQGGPIEVQVITKEPATLWIDEDVFENPDRLKLKLSAGRHRLTVRVEVRATQEPTLRLELHRPPGGSSLFEVVHGE